jgi:hypothetical protein
LLDGEFLKLHHNLLSPFPFSSRPEQAGHCNVKERRLLDLVIRPGSRPIALGSSHAAKVQAISLAEPFRSLPTSTVAAQMKQQLDHGCKLLSVDGSPARSLGHKAAGEAKGSGQMP